MKQGDRAISIPATSKGRQGSERKGEVRHSVNWLPLKTQDFIFQVWGPTIPVIRVSCSLSLPCPMEFLPYQPLLGRHTGNCSGPLVLKGTRNSFKKQTVAWTVWLSSRALAQPIGGFAFDPQH